MKNDNILTIWTNLAVLAGFTAYFLIKSNYEFMIYAGSIVVFIFILAKSDRLFNYPKIAKIGFTVWLILHLLGGSVHLGQTRLYDLMLFDVVGKPYNILKYDQFMHTYCYVVLTLYAHSVVRFVTREHANSFVVAVITILMSMGIGCVNEIIEFSTVALYNATGVGGYFNNALDLVFNTGGALLGLFVIRLFLNGSAKR